MVPRMYTLFRDQRYIINMDETPIFFSMTNTKTLAVTGSRTVNARQSKNASKRVTVAVSVTASGTVLKPMVIFEGKPSGRIAREFPEFNPRAMYCCQERAWQNKVTMIYWVNNLLKPYLYTRPVGVIPMLLLDEYSVHVMPEILCLVQDLGCEFSIIPGGTTCHAQPVDVGINKPLKNRVHSRWNDFLMEQDIDSV